MSPFDINRKEPVLSPRKAELPLHFVPGSRLFLYDIFGWTTEQSPREQQLAVVIYNVCFLVLDSPVALMISEWYATSTRGKHMFPIRDDLDANVAGYVLLT